MYSKRRKYEKGHRLRLGCPDNVINGRGRKLSGPRHTPASCGPLGKMGGSRQGHGEWVRLSEGREVLGQWAEDSGEREGGREKKGRWGARGHQGGQ